MEKFEKDAVKDGVDSVITFYNNEEGIEKFYGKFNYNIGTNLTSACKSL